MSIEYVASVHLESTCYEVMYDEHYEEFPVFRPEWSGALRMWVPRQIGDPISADRPLDEYTASDYNEMVLRALRQWRGEDL